MAISHADHDHPNTPAARAACRKAMGPTLVTDPNLPTQVAADRMWAEITKKPVARIVSDADRTLLNRDLVDGVHPGRARKLNVAKSPGTKGLREAAEAVKTRKKANTKIRGIGDLADMPQMLAYAVRLAWAHDDLEVVAGAPFNDTEANVIIKGKAAHVTLMWKVANPNGISAMRIRPVDSSVCAGDATSAQQAVDIARGVEPIPGR